MPKLAAASTINDVSICKPAHLTGQGLLVTFKDGKVVFYEAAWLYNQREACGNYTLDKREATTLIG